MKRREPECRRDPRIEELADALKALSDANRLRIMCYLSGGERCVCHVESELGISQQLASHHLNVLRDAGLLTLRKKGTWSFYSIDVDNLQRVNDHYKSFLDSNTVVAEGTRSPCCK